MTLLLVGCSFPLASFVLGFTLLALLLTGCFFPQASSDVWLPPVWCWAVFGDLFWGSVQLVFRCVHGTFVSVGW
ncbi:hypothetical protein C1H46_029182 [Malus baccata]|uniref:Uncharacterized protein n=1 Tax=Malus baccata TaxID=106549 RepID=A0A540LFL2_MALBA|nr:hypothetical protein C1H46_029182 [Malus baccata]